MNSIKDQEGNIQLELTHEQLELLEPFLIQNGVRCRTVMRYTTEEGATIHRIQAENPYKHWAHGSARAVADREMREEARAQYKR